MTENKSNTKRFYWTCNVGLLWSPNATTQFSDKFNRLLSKPSESEFLEGGTERRSGTYSGVRKHSNWIDEPKTDSDEFRKKSNKGAVADVRHERRNSLVCNNCWLCALHFICRSQHHHKR
jgi:hypothetical protein